MANVVVDQAVLWKWLERMQNRDAQIFTLGQDAEAKGQDVSLYPCSHCGATVRELRRALCSECYEAGFKPLPKPVFFYVRFRCAVCGDDVDDSSEAVCSFCGAPLIWELPALFMLKPET